MKNCIKKFLKASNGITLIALVITIIVLLILAGISISMLAGDNSILQKSTEAKRTTERAEAKEQAKMDIMAYIADKTANHQNASLDDEKIQEILSDNKSYVKTANATSFITAKGEYEIPYSELYTETQTTPTTPTTPTNPPQSFGFNSSDNTFIGQLTDNDSRTCSGDSEFENGYKFTQGHFILVEDYDGMYPPEDAYFVWDESPYGEITEGSDCFSNCDNFDIYYTNGTFFTGISL